MHALKTALWAIFLPLTLLIKLVIPACLANHEPWIVPLTDSPLANVYLATSRRLGGFPSSPFLQFPLLSSSRTLPENPHSLHSFFSRPWIFHVHYGAILVAQIFQNLLRHFIPPWRSASLPVWLIDTLFLTLWSIQPHQIKVLKIRHWIIWQKFWLSSLIWFFFLTFPKLCKQIFLTSWRLCTFVGNVVAPEFYIHHH